MSAAPQRAALALRVDVDFAPGLRRAVPRMLDALARAGMHATFCVVAGSNAPRRSLKRLLRRGYLRRLLRLGPRGIARWLLPALASNEAMLGSPRAREVLRRILDEGHELAVHGHDHAWWADHAWGSDEALLVAEIDRAYGAMERASGRADLAWVSPAWRTTGAVLQHLKRRGVGYFSDCWGTTPFLTVDERGREIPVPHLPVNAASLESLTLVSGLDGRAAVRSALGGLPADATGVLCIHDYFEGLLHPELFAMLLEECRAAGRSPTTLAATARGLPTALASHRLSRGRVPGFVGEVSWQGPVVGVALSAPRRAPAPPAGVAPAPL